jgi:cytochrome c6
MKERIITFASLLVAGVASVSLAATGQELFDKHCASCHKDGGNIVKPEHTLHKKNLAKEGIKDWKGIVKVMRKPEAGMPTFDKNTIPDKDARAIAEYVLKTFK